MSRIFIFFFDRLYTIGKYAMEASKNCPGFSCKIGIILIIKHIFKTAVSALRLASPLRRSYSCRKGTLCAGFFDWDLFSAN